MSADLEDSLEQAILATEQLRVTFVAVLVGLVFASAVLSITSMPYELNVSAPVLWTVVIVQALFVVHELVIRAVIKRCRRLGRPLSVGLRYSTMFVETSIPTVLLFYGGLIQAPEVALSALPMLSYFLFIAFSTLRMDFKLSLSTGAVAGLSYAALAAWLLRNQGPVVRSAFEYSPMELYGGRAAMMVICGLAAGLVGIELRKRWGQTVSHMRERTRVTELFGQHVSPSVVEKLLVTGAGHESELRKVCVMFLDIRGFTTFAEGRTPKEVVEYLNRIFAVSIDAINRNGGIVNKFLGDGFMAVFGAPLSDGFDSRNAVRASRELIEQLEKLVADGTLPPTKVGIGLHFGDAMTGNIGSAARKEYTIIGDAVNLASRVEALNKEYGSAILATAPVMKEPGVEASGATDLGEVAIRGRADPIRLYRLA
jgi:adenylate cyclase